MTVANNSTAYRSKQTAQSDLGRSPYTASGQPPTSVQDSSRASFSRATMSGKQGGSEQQGGIEQRLTGANKDEYLMNLFRREDMGYTNPQPSIPEGAEAAKSFQGQPFQLGFGTLPGQHSTYPVVNLPGYRGCGMLPQNGAALPQPQQEQQQQCVLGRPGKGIRSEQVGKRIGQEAFSALRDAVLEHEETFVEQIYDLHRLIRRQRHLEANCKQPAAYNAELQRLAAAQQRNVTAASAERVWQAHNLPPQEAKDTNGQSVDPSVERKGSNTPGESSDVAAGGSVRNGDSHSQEQLQQKLGISSMPVTLLQQQQQNLEAAQAQAAAATLEVQRQQSLLTAAAQAEVVQHHNMAAVAQAQAAQNHRSMEAAAQAHAQHQQYMAAAAQAHLQHRQDMVAAAQARAQQQADLAEAHMAHLGTNGRAGGSRAGGGSSGKVGGAGNASGGSAQNGAQSLANLQQDASRGSFMQSNAQPQQQGMMDAQNGMTSGNYPQGYNGMGMPGMMNGYGNYGNFYQGFNGGYPNMNGYQFNPYSFAVAGTGALGCDPMQMWYLHHYGRSEAHAAADAQQRAAERAADAQQHAAAAAAAADAQAAAAQHREARESEEGRQQHRSAVPSVPRWWQDPAQVFGPEVLPEVVARMSSPPGQHGTNISNGSKRHKATSRPTYKHDRDNDWEPSGSQLPKKAKRVKTGNGGRQQATVQRVDEVTSQTNGNSAAHDGNTFGSGGSAFRKIPKRQSVHSIARTSSIGSENSKSSFGANTAANPDGGKSDKQTPPKQMQSAANILVAFSGHMPPH